MRAAALQRQADAQRFDGFATAGAAAVCPRCATAGARGAPSPRSRAVQPPSTERRAVDPARAGPAEEHRHRATSSTSTQRFDGCFSSRKSVSAFSSLTPCFFASGPTCASASGVRTKPGQMALQVMGVFATSSATTLVSPTTPCLAAT
jgi:hypothetical protein